MEILQINKSDLQEIIRQEVSRAIEESRKSEESLMSKLEVARMLNKSLSTISRYRREGRLIPTNSVGLPMYRKDDVIKFIKK